MASERSHDTTPAHETSGVGSTSTTSGVDYAALADRMASDAHMSRIFERRGVYPTRERDVWAIVNHDACLTPEIERTRLIRWLREHDMPILAEGAGQVATVIVVRVPWHRIHEINEELETFPNWYGSILISAEDILLDDDAPRGTVLTEEMKAWMVQNAWYLPGFLGEEAYDIVEALREKAAEELGLRRDE
jgi:hypothetical protein